MKKFLSYLKCFYSSKKSNTTQDYYRIENLPYHDAREHREAQKAKTINFRSL